MIRHNDAVGFYQKAQRFGPIGQALVSLSDLEYAHDQFVMEVHKRYKDESVRMSMHFPRQFKEKTEFLINSLVLLPQLRKVPIFGDGALNLQWLQLQLDELYDVRTVIAHGSIFLSEEGPEGAVYYLTGYRSAEKGRWADTRYELGTGFLADLVATSDLICHYLADLASAIRGDYDWNREYKDEIEMRENRKNLRELVEFGVLEPDNVMRALLQLDDD
jgi:hypothetical protein